MSKVMLVEDDNNLREIYEARLLAEGYEIVSARDGEEALALAVKERPDLIIADVMMPKISGFDMLDILRSTPETKNTKVIMMTALSQAEDKARAAQLGADRYLVKSQVTLEDVAKVAREVLEGTPGNSSNGGFTPPSSPPAPPAPSEPAAPSTPPPAADPPVAPTPVAEPPAAAANSTEALAEPAAQEAAEVKSQIEEFVSSGPATTTPDPSASAAPVASTTDEPAEEKPISTIHTKVIQPLNDISTSGKTSLEELVAKEQVKEDMAKAAAPIINRPIMPQTPPTTPSSDGTGGVDPNMIAL